MERKLQLRRKDALNGFGMFPAAMDGGAGVFAFSIADKQIFIALVERYHFVVAGPLVRINDEKNRMYEIFWQRPGPFDMVVDGLATLWLPVESTTHDAPIWAWLPPNCTV